MADITLKGMTWSHPRGYDPMVACSKAWQEKSGVSIEWDKRSLQDFESFPVEELARQYDLIVIDHPHVGQITDEGCLLPLDRPERARELEALSKGSVGKSFPSYNWRGHQWAFPIDAATQVLAFRPDLIETPPRSWDQVLDLARAGKVLLPLRSPHSLMTFFTLCGNLGHPCSVNRERPFVDEETGKRAFELIRELATHIDPACRTMDPIAVLDRMGESGSGIAASPLIYGYVSYSMQGFRDRRVAFADMPVVGDRGPIGSALGGTGIAVSAFSDHPEAAIDFAYWVAGGEIQSGLYWRSGGQPGHAAGWEDDGANAATLDFYRATRPTLEGAWLRPRHNGYMAFQHAASERLNQGLESGEAAANVVAALNEMFVRSFGTN